MKLKKILAAASGALLLSALCAASCYAEETTGGTAGEVTPAPTEGTGSEATVTAGKIVVTKADGSPVTSYTKMEDIPADYQTADYIITITDDVTTTENITLKGAKYEIVNGVTLKCAGLTVSSYPEATVINNGTIYTSGTVSLRKFTNNGIIDTSGAVTIRTFTNTGTLKIAASQKLTINSGVVNDGQIVGNEGSIMNASKAISGKKPYKSDYYKWNGSDWEYRGVEIIRNNEHYQSYTKMSDALSFATTGDTVRMLDDIMQSLTTYGTGACIVDKNKNITLDLNGKTLELIGNCLFSVDSAYLTIKDSTAYTDAEGKYIAGRITTDRKANNTYTMLVKDNAQLILEDGIIEHAGEGSAIAVDDGTGSFTSKNASVTVDGGLIKSSGTGILLSGSKSSQDEASSVTVESGRIETTGEGAAISGNGTSHYTSITINGGEVYSDTVAIFHPQAGTVNITNGTITGGKTGIEMRSGDLNISGGTITARTTATGEDKNGSGSTITGAAVAVSQHGTNKDIKVNITGGTLEGPRALYEKDLMDSNCDNITITVSNVTATGVVESQNCTGFITGGKFTTDVQKYVASGSAEKTGDGSYEVVQAGAASSEGTYVTGVENGTYSQLEIVDDMQITGNTVQFDVVSGDVTTRINGTLPTEINGGNIRVGLIVTDIPKDAQVDITPVN